MNAPAEFRYLKLTAANAPALAELFEREAVTCHCRYWHFSGDKNAWLARCAHEPEKNRAEFAQAAVANELQGMVALDATDTAVGWLKVTPVAAVSKLYEQRLYRGLACFDGDRRGVLTVGCFLIDERLRRSGIARELLRAAVREGRLSGARAIEAFPRRAEGVSDAELWLGPYPLFVSEGFEVVHDFGPYPVLRLML